MPNISSDYAKNRTMKINRQINECHCYNCRKYEECQTKGVFDDDPGFDFCVNYEDVSYPDDAIDEIFRNLPRLVRNKRDGSIELIDYDNAAEWRGDLERKPSLYQWLPINGNTL